MARKLSRTRDVLEAPTPAPTPPTPTPTTSELTPTSEPTAALALRGAAMLQALGTFERPVALAPEGGASLPYIGFYHEKGGDARDIVARHGPLPTGAPYIKLEGEIYLWRRWAFVSLAEFPYWVATNPADGYRPDLAWLTPQPFGAVHSDGRKKAEQVDAIVLVLPGTDPLPEEFGPVLATLTNWRTTRCPAIRAHVDAVEAATTPEWARANGTLVSVPPRFRCASTLRVEGKQGRNGAYALAKSEAGPISAAQLGAISQWSADEESQEDYVRIREGYDRRCLEITAMARATA